MNGFKKYYAGKFKEHIIGIFAPKRVKRFGIRIAILDFIVFLCHRSSSGFQLGVIRIRDRIVQKYIYKNYGHIIDRFSRAEDLLESAEKRKETQ